MPKTAKCYLVYVFAYVTFSALDVYSTHLVLTGEAGSEANPTAPTSIRGMLISESIFLSIGVFLLWLSQKIGWRAFSAAQTRSYRALDKISKQSPAAMGAPMSLLSSAMIVWTKFFGATNNFLLLGTGMGVYDMLRGMVPIVSDDSFYWLFAVGSNLLFFLAGSAFLYYRWINGKAHLVEAR